MPTRSASRQASAAGPRSLPCQQQTLVRLKPLALGTAQGQISPSGCCIRVSRTERIAISSVPTR